MMLQCCMVSESMVVKAIVYFKAGWLQAEQRMKGKNKEK